MPVNIRDGAVMRVQYMFNRGLPDQEQIPNESVNRPRLKFS